MLWTLMLKSKYTVLFEIIIWSIENIVARGASQ